MFVLQEIHRKINRKIKLTKNQKLFCSALIYILILMASAIYRIKVLNTPYFTDEIGYWAAGAWFAGVDWSPVMSKLPYYGYGYGLFLTPLFSMIKDSSGMFYAAVLLNAFFLTGTFLCIYRIMCILYNKNHQALMFVAFASCMYTYNIVYAHITMSEICLTFFTALMILRFCIFCKKPTFVNNMLWTIMLAALIMIHLRTLTYLIIGIAFWLFIIFRKKQNWKTIVFAFLLTALMCVMVFLIKDYIVDNLYTSVSVGTHLSGNDSIVGRLSILKNIFHIDWWKNFFTSIIGKTFYLCVSTFFLIPVAVYTCIKKALNDEQRLEHSYMLVMLICNLGFNALTMMFPGRVDQFLYGRYVENLLPIYLAIAFIQIIENKKNIKYLVLTSIALSNIFAQVIYNRICESGLNEANITVLPIADAGIAGFPGFKLANVELQYSYYAFLVAAIIAVCWMILSHWSRYVAIIFIIICWEFTAQTAITNYIYNSNETMNTSEMSRISYFSELEKIADIACQTNCKNIYFLFDDDNDIGTEMYFQMFWIQYDMTDRILMPIDSSNINAIAKGDCLIARNYKTIYDELISQYNLIYQNNQYGIFCK